MTCIKTFVNENKKYESVGCVSIINKFSHEFLLKNILLLVIKHIEITVHYYPVHSEMESNQTSQ